MPSPGAYWPGRQPGTARCVFGKILIMLPLHLELLCLVAANNEMHTPVIVSSWLASLQHAQISRLLSEIMHLKLLAFTSTFLICRFKVLAQVILWNIATLFWTHCDARPDPTQAQFRFSTLWKIEILNFLNMHTKNRKMAIVLAEIVCRGKKARCMLIIGQI